MAFIVTDYSEVLFGVMERRAVPPVRSGKFVQLDFGGAEHLVLSPKELSKFHANIVERFCMINSVRGVYNRKKDNFAVNGAGLAVIGGGAWEIDEGARVLKLFGCSQAYGCFDPAGLKEKVLSAPVMTGFAVYINGR